MNTEKERIISLLNALGSEYKNAECELDYSSNFELLVAVILSAQCTDKRVNEVTKVLFKKFNTPQEFAALSNAELEKYIYSCGFYKNKAKNIIACARDLVARFGGVVPDNKEDLKSLAGVGEKTANVVLATAFNMPAIAVDTHVFRLSHRLGLSNGKNVKLVQVDLENIIPKKDWSKMHLALVLHGRYVCHARNPKCGECKLRQFCKFAEQNQGAGRV